MPIHPGTTLTGSNQQLTSSPCTYYGFTIRETSGTAGATVVLWDSAVGAGAPAAILDEITLVAGESAREMYASDGIEVFHGIYVQIVSGSVAGAVRTG